MARPKPLTHPPIVEALLDLRTSIAGEPEMFKALAETLTDEFPTKQQQRNFEAKIEISGGRLPQADNFSLAVRTGQLESDCRSEIDLLAQFKRSLCGFYAGRHSH